MRIVDWATATPTRKQWGENRVAGLVLVVPALWLAWWLGSPLFIDDVANEEFPLTANATVPENVTRAEAESMMEIAAKLESPMEEPMTFAMRSTSAVSLSTGNFRDKDRVCRGSDRATIYQLEDETNVLRLEDLDVTNGPDLHVLLMVDSEGRDKSQGYIDLGKLKGNIGNQNYRIPDDVVVSDYHAVMTYCQPFHVVFSTAPLE